MKITLLLPLPPPALSPNARTHFQQRARVTSAYRDLVAAWATVYMKEHPEFVFAIHRARITETYRIAGKRKHDVRNLFAACKTLEDALCPPIRVGRGRWATGAGILPGDDDSVLEHGAPRIERVKTKAEEGVLVEIEEIA